MNSLLHFARCVDWPPDRFGDIAQWAARAFQPLACGPAPTEPRTPA